LLAQLAETLRYNLECRGFDSQCDRWNYWLKTSSSTMALGLPQSLMHLITRSTYWRGKAVRV